MEQFINFNDLSVKERNLIFHCLERYETFNKVVDNIGNDVYGRETIVPRVQHYRLILNSNNIIAK
jgi:hypothetical protein